MSVLETRSNKKPSFANKEMKINIIVRRALANAKKVLVKQKFITKSKNFARFD